MGKRACVSWGGRAPPATTATPAGRPLSLPSPQCPLRARRAGVSARGVMAAAIVSRAGRMGRRSIDRARARGSPRYRLDAGCGMVVRARVRGTSEGPRESSFVARRR